MRITSIGNVGIGTTVLSSKLHISETQTNTAFAMPVSLNVSTTATPSSTSDAIFQSAQFEVISNAPVTYNSGMRGVSSHINNTGAGTIWTARGLYVNIARSSGTIDTAYGLYLDNIQATNKYGVYQADAVRAVFI